MFADIVGFEEYGRSLDSEHALDALNDLVKAFDEAADRLGVERVRSTRQGYLASCGLTVPRVDAPRRIVEFALEMEAIVHRFGAQQGTTLQLRAGIDKGTVTSGLVGRQAVVYDLWGDAVNLAFRLQGEASVPGVFVSQAVADRVEDVVALQDAGLVQSDSGTQRVWRIDRLEVVETADGVTHG